MSFLRERFTAEPRVHVRWMIRRDFPAVARIAAGPGGARWTEDDLRRATRRKNTIGMVAERGDEVVGFMVYELAPDRIYLHDFGVALDHRRTGVGRRLMERLLGKLSWRRRGLFVLVRETNLGAQRFFAACGLRAEHVAREWFRDTGEDAYSFAAHADAWGQPPEREGGEPCLGI